MIGLLGPSRCGSTWVAEMLGYLAAPFVLEPVNMTAVHFNHALQGSWAAGRDWGPGVCGLDGDAAQNAQELSARMVRLAADTWGADLSQRPDVQQRVYAAIDELAGLLRDGTQGYKQHQWSVEFAERWGGRLVYLVRHPIGHLSALCDLLDASKRGKPWSLHLADNVRRFHPERWEAIDAPDTTEGELAKMYRILTEFEWSRLRPMGARLFWFESLVANYNSAWGDLLDYLALEPTQEFKLALQLRVAPPAPTQRTPVLSHRPALAEAIRAVFGTWEVGYGGS